MSTAPVQHHDQQPGLSPPEPPAGGRSRVAGLDVARGLALVGMIATHTLPLTTDDGAPTAVTTVAAGRAAATFVLVAGIGVALLSGGRHRLDGRERVAASAGILVRALAVGVLGLVLGALSPVNGIWGILPFYALLFVLVLPLLGLGARGAALVTAGVVAAGPVLLVMAEGLALPRAGADDPTFADVLREPLAVLVQLLVTGAYPVVVLLGFLTAGLAIGRLDLSSRRVAWSLCAGGVALAVAARVTSWVLLYPLGGLARLVQDAEDPAEATTSLLWEEHQPLSTWWHLALPAPHSHTPVDLLHTLGSAVAVLGAALLLTRVPVLRRLLSPLAAAGSLVLTLYCAHLVLLATGFLSEYPVALFLVMLVGGLGGAAAWRRGIGQGPLEKAVSVAAGAARRAVATHTARASGATVPAGPGPFRGVPAGPGPLRGVVAPVAALLLVVALGLVVRSQAGAGDPADDGGSPGVAAATAAPAVPPATGTARFCELTDRYATLLESHPDDPRATLDEGAATVRELERSAPAELRGPVGTLVDELRAEAGTTGAVAPGPAAVESAETVVDEFVDDHCD
ncbi:Uncharacterized membrane protein YeiB [Pseudonocardia ammonioxydans]|uniref:Uncharacterized membrane protein YeiB n=1 Tax=Pseudonocardia ammonioxydans TaxID=260086 RepID=A0A1I5AIM9_PSUAM|nr:heparan-alpha-glucosaminide N-acetyltransferase domain-containing protein [Pseudonocardia ammonioxydans]SFN62334.1 Uncharacterized membrane protein YeiB [Pseudonocardia ammonioxydans]